MRRFRPKLKDCRLPLYNSNIGYKTKSPIGFDTCLCECSKTFLPVVCCMRIVGVEATRILGTMAKQLLKCHKKLVHENKHDLNHVLCKLVLTIEIIRSFFRPCSSLLSPNTK